MEVVEIVLFGLNKVGVDLNLLFNVPKRLKELLVIVLRLLAILTHN
jgi:hypothetical protein